MRVCRKKNKIWIIAIWILFFMVVGSAITYNFFYWNLSTFFGLIAFTVSSVILFFIALFIFAMLFALVKGNTYALPPRTFNTNDYFWYYKE